MSDTTRKMGPNTTIADNTFVVSIAHIGLGKNSARAFALDQFEGNRDINHSPNGRSIALIRRHGFLVKSVKATSSTL